MSVENLPLRYAATVLVSNVDKKSADGEIPVRLVNYTDVYYRPIIRPDQEFMMATATMDQVARFGVRPGDSIITKDSETPDDIAVSTYVEQSASDMVCGYHLALLRPSDRVVPKFLSWALASDQVRGQFSIRANGMTRYGLTYEAIQSVVVPLPPLEEQRRIADFLDDQVTRIDRVCELRTRQARLLGDVANASVHNIFEAFAQRFGVAPLRRYVGGIEQGGSPVAGEPGGASDLAVLKTSAIKAGRFLAQENKALLDPEKFEASCELGEGDVLVVRGSGSSELVADVAEVVLPSNAPRIMLSDLTYRLVDLKLEPAFAVGALLAPQARSQMRSLVRQGSGPAKARGEDVLSIEIPRATCEAQREFAGLYWQVRNDVDAMSATYLRALTLLEDYKRSLITAAVTGQLDVTTARSGLSV